MEYFDIRNFIWNVFELAEYNELSNIFYGLDMLIANLSLPKIRYEGSTLKYKEPSEFWMDLTYERKQSQRKLFSITIRYHYIDLYEAYLDNDRDLFDRIALSRINYEEVPVDTPKDTHVPKRMKKRHRTKKHYSLSV